MKKTVHVADQAGYCFGVRRALEMVKEHLSEPGKTVYSLGPIIHNPKVVEEFRGKGLIPVDTLDAVNEGVLVIRSHGVEKELLEEARRKGLVVIDATCPFVKNAQRLARKLSKESYQVIIVGEESHPEVKGILSYSGADTIVVGDSRALVGKSIGPKVGVLAQTTQSQDNFVRVIEAILANTHECRVYNTICNATLSRQNAAAELAGTMEVMIVVGGKNSANTLRLAELCRSAGATTHHIESEDELVPDMIHGAERIGITAGASTPRAHVERVKKKIEQIVP